MKTSNIIAITGSNGFIGKHLAQYFIDKDYKVAGVPREYLDDPVALKVWMEKCNPSIILHLASYGNIYDQTDDDETISTNYLKSYFLLKATKDIPYKALINFSSSSAGLPVQTLYSATKMGIEALCKAYSQKYNKPIATIRPFTVIGPGDNSKHLVPTLIEKCMNNEEIELVEEPVHDYISVHDLVLAIETIIDNIQEVKGESIDIGSGKETSNIQILKTVEEVIGNKCIYRKVSSLRPYDNATWKADTTKLHKLGFKAEWTPKECVEEIYKTKSILNQHD